MKNKLSATFVSEHYSDESNTTERKIPSYSVFDYSGEWSLSKNIFNLNSKIIFGINNILDKKYYTRVRSTGIEPALDRNYFLGFNIIY